ncbi:tryptophan 7-halogenase [Thalassotalea sp. M1531]|uniref:Tryptophan 7-halogenase n=1 Tax=Thalassotalea algicola TaxID=2716224 RepID=A0A7Y0L9V2_9GAMM|nr:tryptophan halogenase family protein [Thalassotalea algicola]NMP30278.1 tryptophan 7-halogenase [Thalassotalea algicola]
MNSGPVSSIIVVGGGSSGWMSALYLNRLYNQEKHTVDITVIESKDIGIIGVGEATVHSIRFFFAAMGLDEAELLKETNATLKAGIMFNNWMKPVDGKMHQYFHPFEHVQIGPGLDIASRWLLSGRGEIERFDQGASLSAHLIEKGHSPKMANARPYEGAVPYGYHLDATLMSRYLRKKATEAGVKHIEGTVSQVNVNGENIESIVTEHGVHQADIYLDSTGFRGLLINQVKSDNWQSFEDALPCNKAVAMQIAYDDDQVPNPYTTATALDNGWAWQIDLVNRRGTGYVYDGNRISKEQAEAALIAHNGENATILKTVHLDMNVGCRKEFWVGNCVAIGLSGGFIEPLESTGLHIINIGVRLLATHLSSNQIPQEVRDSYNRLMNGAYQDLKQFIVLHYCLTNRDDTEFWQQAQRSVDFCPELKRNLTVWQHKVCEYFDLAGGYSTTFTDENYRFILYGMQHYPNLNMQVDEEHSKDLFEKLGRKATQTVQNTLSHEAFIQSLHDMSLSEIADMWRNH